MLQWSYVQIIVRNKYMAFDYLIKVVLLIIVDFLDNFAI